MQAWLRDRGVEVCEVPGLSPKRAIDLLNERNCLSVLWECGGALSAQAIADGSVQKILAFIAPKIVGGVVAPSPVGDLGLTKMIDAIALERVTWRSVGADFAIEGYLRID
jgi:diaminohydroxyphosphoribosylaminopyrimidine deaminase/5-amino-6-(5-phosphoribosylamino)uracil reductase